MSNIRLNLYELQKLGKVLEALYNSKFERILNKPNRSSDFNYDKLILENNNNNYELDCINKLMILMDRVHKVHQYYLGDSNNEYKISLNLLNNKKKFLIIHSNNINELINEFNSNVFKRDDVNYINALKNQYKAIDVAINKLDKLKEELMSREIIELDEILDIDELC